MDGTPQFGTAEYRESSAGDVCTACHQPITGVYYRAHTALLCGSCAENLQRQIPQDTHAAFVRGIIFGCGGFVLGLILYAGFTILTGIEIGFVSLAVGWLVGKAMMMGSGGVGGRRYQIAAVLLTYAAVSLAFVPILIHYMKTNPEKFSSEKTQIASSAKPEGDSSASQNQPASGGGSSGQGKSTPNASSASQPSMGRAEALGKLLLLGLASPFLQLASGFSGIIGLFILFIGMQFAWKITRGIRLAISGPYQISATAKA